MISQGISHTAYDVMREYMIIGAELDGKYQIPMLDRYTGHPTFKALMFIVRTARTLVHFADSSHRLMSFHNSGHLAKSCSHSAYMTHLWQSCLPICFAYCRITFLHISTSSGVISNFSSLPSMLFSFSLLLHIQICLLLRNLLGHILDYGRP